VQLAGVAIKEIQSIAQPRRWLVSALTALLLLGGSLAAGAGELVYAARDGGRCSVRVRTPIVSTRARPPTVTLQALCRYQPGSDHWAPVALPAARSRLARPNPYPPAARSMASDTLLFDVTMLAAIEKAPALIAIEWTAEGTRSSAVLACGGILCQDLDLRAPPPGKIAACAPGKQSAEARFVADPELECFARFDVAGAPRQHTAATAQQAMRLLGAALAAGDLRSIQELTTRAGLLSLRRAVPDNAELTEHWHALGQGWAKAPMKWLSEREVLIGDERKPARAEFVQDSRGWRLAAWSPGA
jgi:hypothetical protein